MAWTERNRSKSYRAMYRDENGKRRSAGSFATEKQALGKAVAAEDEARRRQPSSDLTWREWSERWVPSRKVEQSTAARDKSRIENHIMPRWGDVPLSQIRRPDVQAWVDSDLSTLAPSSVQKVIAVLGSSLRAAMNAGLLSTNEATALNLPTIPPSPERWLSGDELDAIRAVLAESYLFTFELLVGTGTRWGEAVGLHYDDVDLHRKTIRIRWAWDRRNHLMKSPKTRQTRTVPISDRLANLIQERLDADGLGTPPDVEYQGGRRPLYGLVLRGTNGLPVNPTSFAHGLTAAGNAAFVGAEGRKDRRRVGAVRTHDLRHSWASSLVQKGVPIDTVSKLLGHSNLTTTQRYADAADSQWDAVRNALG